MKGLYRDSAAVGSSMTATTVIGKVSDVVGDATITRKDKKIPAEIGTPVYSNDVIETSVAGAVNILFADDTSFAVSESARLSIREYIYDKQRQSGKSVFSLAQGVFVYTSGLIGKNDPGDVAIETPVASIGIRGTVVAGNIRPSGQDSKITLVDGAIVLTNSGGSLDMSGSLQTATVTDYNAAPSGDGRISPQEFASSYQPVSFVAAKTFRSVASGGDFYGMTPRYTLTATLDGQEFTESAFMSAAEASGKPVFISGDAPLQMKVELRDPSGKVTDVTRDERTLYTLVRGGWLTVSPTGLVSMVESPLYDEESAGRDEEMAIMVLYRDIRADGPIYPDNALATVVVRVKVR